MTYPTYPNEDALAELIDDARADAVASMGSLRSEALDRLIDVKGWASVDDLLSENAFAKELFANCALATTQVAAFEACRRLREAFASMHDIAIDSMIEPRLRAVA